MIIIYSLKFSSLSKMKFLSWGLLRSQILKKSYSPSSPTVPKT